MVTAFRVVKLATLAFVFLVSGCAETEFLANSVKSFQGVKGKPTYKIGEPYEINGELYEPRVDYGYSESGIASWYGPDFHGKATANGEIYDMNRLTAAHRTLPLPSIVRVTNLENGRALVVRVNDRGPFSRGRIIDLSKRAAELLDFTRNGTALVRVDILPRESRLLAAKLAGKPPPKDDRPPAKPAPSIQVTSDTIPPPVNGRTEEPPTPNHKVITMPARSNQKLNGSFAIAKVDGTVSEIPVKKAPEVFIQVGAFRQFANANRVKARLSDLGQTRITEVANGHSQVFRVRIGPLTSVDEADSLLVMVSATGFHEARIVVD